MTIGKFSGHSRDDNVITIGCWIHTSEIHKLTSMSVHLLHRHYATLDSSDNISLMRACRLRRGGGTGVISAQSLSNLLGDFKESHRLDVVIVVVCLNQKRKEKP
uniref:Uncharacterized protein n=1 Tax=Glossina palpalis gambiensis TaxID=67801 RepID=A0A1B0B9M5_9MUSC